VTLLVLFTGLLWLLGLISGKGGRQYVTKISDQAMRTASVMLQGACPAVVDDRSGPGRGGHPSAW
jgi:hypothetical protein